MINRKNWIAAKEYLKYRKEVHLLSEGSLKTEWRFLVNLLHWLNDHDFNDAPKLRPTYSVYFGSIAAENRYSRGYVHKTIRGASMFFSWLIIHKSGYPKITKAWIDTLRAPRVIEYPKERKIPSYEYMLQLIETPAETMRERRIKAAVCFWFLSGIRVGAFVTLPIKAIDLKNLEVKQWPSLGVKTKFTKHATTYMLNIPELFEIVQQWDDEVRSVLPDFAYWFASVRTDKDEFLMSGPVGKHRGQRAGKDIKAWQKKYNLELYSPHKFRHGNAVYALRNAKTVAELKAISQNLMHSNLSITDGIYSVLNENDLKSTISRL